MRRQQDTEQMNKIVIVATICMCAIIIVVTMCVMAIRATTIPPELKDLALLVLGAITGFMAKTGVETIRQMPSGQDIGTGIAEASQDNPISTTEVDPKQDKKVDSVPIGENV
jgi:hypothetical protein